MKKLAQGNVSTLVARVDEQMQRVELHLESQGMTEKKRAIAKDAAVVAGIALTMLGIKALKILPSIPFAPGHKLVLLTPLYLVASMKTRSRFGGTLTGITMGTVAFLLGDGRYGVFEIAKHITPGLVADLARPLYGREGKTGGTVMCSLVGAFMGSMRFSTILFVVLLTQAPKVAYAMLVPGLVVHTTFGLLSGLVSAPLVRAFGGGGPSKKLSPAGEREAQQNTHEKDDPKMLQEDIK